MFFLPRFQVICVKNNCCPQVWGIAVPMVGACLPLFRRFLSLGLGHVRSLLGSYCPSNFPLKSYGPRIQHQTKCKKTCSSIAWLCVEVEKCTAEWRDVWVKAQKHVRQHSMTHLWNWNNESVNSGKTWRKCGSAPICRIHPNICDLFWAPGIDCCYIFNRTINITLELGRWKVGWGELGW